MAYIDFMSELHKSTKRNYISYNFLTDYDQLEAGQKVLDVGCGMAHLLYETTQVVPGCASMELIYRNMP